MKDNQMRKRYRYLFSSRQDFKKTMVMLFIAASGLGLFIGALLVSKLGSAVATSVFLAAATAAIIWVVCKTDLVEYEK